MAEQHNDMARIFKALGNGRYSKASSRNAMLKGDTPWRA